MNSLRFGRAEPRAWRISAPALHDIVWWVLAAAIVFATVRLLYMAVTPVSPVGDWRPAGVRLMDDAARSSLLGSFDPFNRTSPSATVSAGPDVITDLPLTLYGIRVHAATGGGTAIVAGSDGQQMLYRIGEEIMPGVTLAAIAFDHVALNHNGASELLYLDQSEPAPTAAPATPSAGGATGGADSPLSAASLRRGIAISPRARNGGVDGLEVSATGDGAAFRAAGLREGDVVVAVGGQKVSGAGDLSRLSGQFRPGSTVALTVSRDGKEVPVSVSVSP